MMTYLNSIFELLIIRLISLQKTYKYNKNIDLKTNQS